MNRKKEYSLVRVDLYVVDIISLLLDIYEMFAGLHKPKTII